MYYGWDGSRISVSEWVARMRLDHHVGSTLVGSKRVGGKHQSNSLWVSTVYLGIDHGFEGNPLIFETMIFGGDFEDQYCERYATLGEAIEGHQRAVKFAKRLRRRLWWRHLMGIS